VLGVGFLFHKRTVERSAGHAKQTALSSPEHLHEPRWHFVLWCFSCLSESICWHGAAVGSKIFWLWIQVQIWTGFNCYNNRTKLYYTLLCVWILPSSGLLRGVRCFEADVLGLPTGPIFKGQAWTAWTLKVGQIGSPATSVSNHFSQSSNPEDRRIQLNRCGSLCYRTFGQIGSHLYVFILCTQNAKYVPKPIS
jgi:hypothetical protein